VKRKRSNRSAAPLIDKRMAGELLLFLAFAAVAVLVAIEILDWNLGRN